MVVGNFIQRIQSLYSKGVESDDSRLMRRHIYSKMLSTRSLLIHNKVNKKQFLSRWNYTLLGCVELIKVSGNDCPCLATPGCQVLRSKFKLPKPANSINGYIIDSVTSMDGSVIFDQVTHLRKNWRLADKYTSKKPDYFIKDDYLYITLTRKLKAVSVRGVFVDPVEAMNHPSLCDNDDDITCPVHPLDIEFPIDDELVDSLIEMSVKELTAGFSFGKEDRANDSNDNDGTPPQREQRRR